MKIKKKPKRSGLKRHNKYLFEEDTIKNHKKADVIEEICLGDSDDDSVDIKEIEEITLEDNEEHKENDDIIIEREIIDVSESEDIFSDNDGGSSVISTDGDISDYDDYYSQQSSLSGLSDFSDEEREEITIKDEETKPVGLESKPEKIDSGSKSKPEKIDNVSKSIPEKIDYDSDDSNHQFEMQEILWRSLNDEFPAEQITEKERFSKPGWKSVPRKKVVVVGTAKTENIADKKVGGDTEKSSETKICVDVNEDNCSVNSEDSHYSIVDLFSDEDFEVEDEKDSISSLNADESHAAQSNVEKEKTVQEAETVVIEDNKESLSYRCLDGDEKDESSEQTSLRKDPLDLPSEKLNGDGESCKTENSILNTETWMLIKDPNILFFCPKCGFKRKCGDYIQGATCFCGGAKYKVKRFRCDLCDMFFTTNYLLNNHLELHINEGKIPATISEERKYRCEICGRCYSSKNAVSQHLRCHNRSFKCEPCDKTFSKYVQLKQHMTFHSSGKQITTPSDKISEKKYLKKNSSGKVKIRKCKLCDETFYKKRHLRRHIMSQVCRKKRKCKFCDESFYRKRELRKHLLSHDSKSKKCKFCGVCYEKSDTKRHICVIEIE